MLFRIEKKILKTVKRISRKKYGKGNYNNIGSAESILKEKRLKKYNIYQIRNALVSLDEKELLCCEDCDGTVGYIYLTQNGERYTEYVWHTIKSFLLKSILTPILVSAVVSFITVLVTA